MNVGKNIRKYRKIKGITMKQLGKLIGISEQGIGNYERGDRNASLIMLNELATALDTNINDLIEVGNNNTPPTLGENIKYYRNKLKLTQEQLAIKSELSRTGVHNYECGTRQPNIKILTKIANSLNVTISTLAENDNKISDVNIKILKCVNGFMKELGLLVEEGRI